MLSRTNTLLTLLMLVIFALSACGEDAGGGDTDPTPDPTPAPNNDPNNQLNNDPNNDPTPDPDPTPTPDANNGESSCQQACEGLDACGLLEQLMIDVPQCVVECDEGGLEEENLQCIIDSESCESLLLVCFPDPACQDYCTAVQANCQGEAQVYVDDPSCFEACNAFSFEGQMGDIEGDTLQCRQTYAELAANDPISNCPSASPEGGGICIEITDPCADFPDPSLAVPNCGFAPMTVQFDATGFVDGFTDLSGVVWEFGDGERVFDDLTPVHTYLEAGDYSATFSFSGVTGDTRVDISLDNLPIRAL